MSNGIRIGINEYVLSVNIHTHVYICVQCVIEKKERKKERKKEVLTLIPPPSLYLDPRDNSLLFTQLISIPFMHLFLTRL